MRAALDSLPDRIRRVRSAVHTEWRQQSHTRPRRVTGSWSLGALVTAALVFVRSHCPAYQELVPQAWIDYRRITLLNARTAERVTIDLELLQPGKEAALIADTAHQTGLVVAPVQTE